MRRSLSSLLVSLLLLLVTACSNGISALPHSTKPPSTSPSVPPLTTATATALLPVSTTHLSPGRNFLLLQSATPIPAACPVNPVYAGSVGKLGLDRVPWIQADPSSSHLTAFLFFVEPTYTQTHLYQSLHTGGGYSDGRSTKILWILDAPHPPGEVTITGVKVSSTSETFHQTFPVASSATPGANYPSIVNVPTPGCWQIQFGRSASVLFWVTGN